MKILSKWLRSYLPALDVTDRQLADDLTLRGVAVEGVFDLGEDNGSLFEMDITTNRVDAMNHYGVAREAAAIYNVPLLPLDVALPEPTSVSKPYPVRIEAPDLCGRFTAQVLRGVKIGPSAGLVAEYFKLLEQKYISNAVDATNFAWLAMGHPTHAFDLDKLEGGIVVRRAVKGEKIKLLDGTERTLEADDLVVADEKKAVGLAGVMGGWDTMITPETKNVLVEAAWFDPAAIRRSSRRHGLHTDASHRFERGADINAAPVANAMVSKLMLAAGGTLEGALVDVVVPEVEARTAKRPAIALAYSEVTRHLGTTEDRKGIPAETVEQYLKALGCELQTSGDGAYQVALPSWRLDLEREIDLIEEVARVYGYNKFANTLPAFAGGVVELPWARKESTLRTSLLALGYSEAVSSTFCSASDAALFSAQPNSAVAMGNPLSEEAGMLRPSLLPGMLTMLAHNLNRDVFEAQLFEMGTVFSGSTERVDERPALAIGFTGAAKPTSLYPEKDAPFYEMKGAVEALLGKFTHKSLYFDAFALETGLMPEWLHPGRGARVVLDGATVGFFGQLHPAEAQRRKLKQPVFVGEIYLDRLYKQALRQPVSRELSRYPAVQRDFSFLFADTTRWEQIASALESLQIPTLVSKSPEEIFRDAKGKAVPTGQYSLLVRTVFQSPERTLREDEISSYSESIMQTLTALGGKLRG
ncbi:MAG: phenylalanine--tRNA ligase subunit beta [Acidobacteriaceae bacterium]